MEQEVRRLKRLFKDPNPLFTAWLTEWRDEADRKDTKMKYVYGMALKSLRQYPLPLTSGKSCNILKGFGVTLCTRLDERLHKHIEQHGPLPALGIEDQVQVGGPKSKAPSKKRPPKPKPPEASSEPLPSPTLDGSPRSQTGRRAAEYRPKPGSGGFALLVTLRRQEKKQGYTGFLHKGPLQEAAQPLCSASMTLPEAGGYYTAWSSMATLVKRKLVLREGNPPRFSLSAAGRELADRLEASPCTLPSQRACFDRLDSAADQRRREERGGPSGADRRTSRDRLDSAPDQRRRQERGGPSGADRRTSGDRLSTDRSARRETDESGSRPAYGHAFSPTPAPVPLPRQTVSSAAPAAPVPLSYHYVSSSGGPVRRKDEAHVSVEGARVGFLVRCRREALQASRLTYWPDPSRPERDGVVHVFLLDQDCAELCPEGPSPGPGPDRPGTAAKDRPRRLHDMSDTDSDEEPVSYQTQSQSRSVPQSESPSQSLPQSQSQSLPQSQRRSGCSLKRPPTDWSAALKRLRSDSSGGDLPSAAASTSGSAASLASGGAAFSGTALAMSDEDYDLLADDDDDDDDDAVLLAASEAPPQPSLDSSDEETPLTRPNQSGSSHSSQPVVPQEPVQPSCPAAPGTSDPPARPDPGTTDRTRPRPQTAAQEMRERAAAAAEARARGRLPSTPPATADTGARLTPRTNGGPVHTPPATPPAPADTGTRDTPRTNAGPVHTLPTTPPATADTGTGHTPRTTGGSVHTPPVTPTAAAHIGTRHTPRTTGGSVHTPPTTPPAPADTGTGHTPRTTGGSVHTPPARSGSCPVRAAVKEVSPAVTADGGRGGLAAETAADVRTFTPSVVLQPGTFDIILCVDNQETSGKSGPGACLRTYRDVVVAELQKNGVTADVRKLSVGDFLWVARPRTGRQPEELVLPYVVERKRLDDLASSIRDSRYREQKFRLRRCGLPHVIYLAEALGTGPRAHSVRLPESTLQQALANCQVIDGFRVKWTADQRETAAFLTLMTRRLQTRYQYRQLEGCPRGQLPASPPAAGLPERLQLFSEFHQLSAKRRRLTAGDVFAKMLLQLSGLSVDKAAAIVSVYPTLARLLEGYWRCSSPAEAEALLAPLRAERSGRPVGAAVSRAVYHLYSDQHLA